MCLARGERTVPAARKTLDCLVDMILMQPRSVSFGQNSVQQYYRSSRPRCFCTLPHPPPAFPCLPVVVRHAVFFFLYPRASRIFLCFFRRRPFFHLESESAGARGVDAAACFFVLFLVFLPSGGCRTLIKIVALSVDASKGCKRPRHTHTNGGHHRAWAVL